MYDHSLVSGRLCGRMGRSVGTTRNSTESGRSQVQSQVAAGAKHGEFSSREKSHGFSPVIKFVSEKFYDDSYVVFSVIKYQVSVHTVDGTNAGITANVQLLIGGQQGSSGKRELKKSSNNDLKFQQGQVDKTFFFFWSYIFCS